MSVHGVGRTGCLLLDGHGRALPCFLSMLTGGGENLSVFFRGDGSGQIWDEQRSPQIRVRFDGGRAFRQFSATSFGRWWDCAINPAVARGCVSFALYSSFKCLGAAGRCAPLALVTNSNSLDRGGCRSIAFDAVVDPAPKVCVFSAILVCDDSFPGFHSTACRPAFAKLGNTPC